MKKFKVWCEDNKEWEKGPVYINKNDAQLHCFDCNLLCTKPESVKFVLDDKENNY